MAEGAGAGTGARAWGPVAAAAGPVVLVGGLVTLCVGLCTGFPCATTGLRYGVWPSRCPSSELRLDLNVSASGLLRGQDGGGIDIVPQARWLDGEGRDAYPQQEVLRRGFSWDVTLLDAAGTEVEGLDLGRREGGRWGFRVPAVLPDVPDGDYTLRVKVDAGFEAAELDVPVPVYAPAVVHLMTDRPLYKPGQEVLLRSVVLRRTDWTALPGRPGRWRIVDPEGTEMLVEKDVAGPWGVADGSFPLDADARIGRWTATWESGGASDSVSFDVRPFRLPRLVVEPQPSAAWFAAGDEVVIEGRARYTSGAPVANAPVTVTLAVADGRWAPPLEWEEPREVRTGTDGSFTVSYGAVPPDLIDRTRLRAEVRVVEAAGEAANGSTTVVVSRDSLAIDVLTELAGGLVEGFNNRTYLRVTTPDGRALADASLVVKRPYDPADPGKEATTDVDGVAALQLDPGPPVTVVIPAPPYRPRPPIPDPPRLVSASRVADGAPLDLDERRSLDERLQSLERCRTFAVGDQDVPVGVQVDSTGAARRVVAAEDPLSECVGAAMAGLRMPSGDARTYALTWRIPDAQLPSITASTTNAFGSAAIDGWLAQAAARSRACFAPGQGVDGAEVLTLHWAVDAGSRSVGSAIHEAGGSGLSPTALTCVRTALSGGTLAEPAAAPAMGATRFTLHVPRPAGAAAQESWTQTGYELAVSATADGAEAGSGTVVVGTGAVPSVRLRADPSLASPGDEVVIQLIRGPGFYGELPDELGLYDGTAEVVRADVVENKVTLKLPDTARGFLHADFAGARAVVFVRDPSPLSVALSTPRATYRPGETAELTVTTRAGDAPVAAAVGLVGVDAALAQLAPLVDPNDFGRVTVRATSDHPAFGAFDPRALTLGQIRGENAAKAAVLAITSLPDDPKGDAPSSGSASVASDVEGRATLNFYRALERATTKVRAWEAAAGPGELLAPEQMVAFWDDSLAELADEGEPAVDGFGRTLELSVLSLDRVQLTDPRTLVVDAARLPEDFVGWTQYVTQEVR